MEGDFKTIAKITNIKKLKSNLCDIHIIPTKWLENGADFEGCTFSES